MLLALSCTRTQFLILHFHLCLNTLLSQCKSQRYNRVRVSKQISKGSLAFETPANIFFWKVENETIMICFPDGSSSPLSNSMQICNKQNKIFPSRSCTYLLPELLTNTALNLLKIFPNNLRSTVASSRMMLWKASANLSAKKKKQ